jgi:hypothetical protein
MEDTCEDDEEDTSSSEEYTSSEKWESGREEDTCDDDISHSNLTTKENAKKLFQLVDSHNKGLDKITNKHKTLISTKSKYKDVLKLNVSILY